MAINASSTFPYEGIGNGLSTEGRWSLTAGQFAPSGICLSYAGGIGKATSTGGLTWTINPFLAIAQGTYCEFDTITNLTAVAGPVSGNRIDRYVMRRNLNTNSASIVRIEGTPSVAPSAPAITRSAGIWDNKMFAVRVNQGATSIQSITDEREISSGIDNDTGGSVCLFRQQLTEPSIAINATDLPIGSFDRIQIGGLLTKSGTWASITKTLLQFDTKTHFTGSQMYQPSSNTSTGDYSSAGGLQLSFVPLEGPSIFDVKTVKEKNLFLQAVSGTTEGGNQFFRFAANDANLWLLGNLKLYNNSAESFGRGTFLTVHGLR